jgi:chromosome segregation ATPase
VEEQLNDHIEKLNDQLATACKTIETNQQAIARLQKTVSLNQRLLTEKSNEMMELEASRESELSKLGLKYQSERDSLVQNYEKALSELKQQCDGHRSALESVSHELSDADERVKKQRAMILELKRDQMRLKSEVETLTEKNKRDAQMSQAMLKNATLVTESGAAQKLRDARAKFDDEKQKIFMCAAEEFRTHFKPSEALDEHAYRALLRQVKAELKRLADSDEVVRKLTSARPRQSTCDAVAQLLP